MSMQLALPEAGLSLSPRCSTIASGIVVPLASYATVRAPPGLEHLLPTLPTVAASLLALVPTQRPATRRTLANMIRKRHPCIRRPFSDLGIPVSVFAGELLSTLGTDACVDLRRAVSAHAWEQVCGDEDIVGIAVASVKACIKRAAQKLLQLPRAAFVGAPRWSQRAWLTSQAYLDIRIEPESVLQALLSSRALSDAVTEGIVYHEDALIDLARQSRTSVRTCLSKDNSGGGGKDATPVSTCTPLLSSPWAPPLRPQYPQTTSPSLPPPLVKVVVDSPLGESPFLRVVKVDFSIRLDFNVNYHRFHDLWDADLVQGKLMQWANVALVDMNIAFANIDCLARLIKKQPAWLQASLEVLTAESSRISVESLTAKCCSEAKLWFSTLLARKTICHRTLRRKRISSEDSDDWDDGLDGKGVESHESTALPSDGGSLDWEDGDQDTWDDWVDETDLDYEDEDGHEDDDLEWCPWREARASHIARSRRQGTRRAANICTKKLRRAWLSLLATCRRVRQVKKRREKPGHTEIYANEGLCIFLESPLEIAQREEQELADEVAEQYAEYLRLLNVQPEIFDKHSSFDSGPASKL